MNNSGQINVFDRPLVRRHRDRAATTWQECSFLMEEVGNRLLERLDEINRPFDIRLDLGAHAGHPALAARPGLHVSSDLSGAMARLAPGLQIVADEEWLPFAPASFDLVFSNLSLHWVNDLPGSLVQINQVLKPDGLLLASMFGSDTLFELRTSLMQAEEETMGGISPRISPFTDVRDLGSLLQRAGFALPVTDADTITVNYSSPFKLLADLRGMGETNAVHDRIRRPLMRSTLMRALEIYQTRFGRPDGKVPATFNILYMTGWHPHESQQQPLKPGSAKTSLAAALGSEEIKVKG